MATLATETFPGTAGAAWPTKWTTGAASGGAVTQDGAGYGALTSTASAYGYGDFAYLTAVNTRDQDITFDALFPVMAEQYLVVELRASTPTTSGAPSNCYYMQIRADGGAGATLDVGKIVGGTQTHFVAFTIGPAVTAGTAIRFRFQAIGNTIGVKWWTPGAAEPATWNYTTTDTALSAATGTVALQMVAGAAATARTGKVATITVTDGTATVVYPTGTPMQFWKAAAAAKNATALFIGTSMTEGQGASAKAKRWLDLIQAPVRANAAVAGGGVGYLPALYWVYAPDSVWTPYSAQTGTHATDFGAYSPGRRADTMSAGATTTYTVTGTSADLWWIAGYGSFTYKVDGGAAVTANTAGTAGQLTKTPITLGAAGTHTVLITATTAVHFAGIMVYNGDATSGIRFVDAAKTGSEINDFAGMGQVWAAFAPDLAVIELGVNEFNRNNATAAQVKARLQSLISDIRGAVGKSLSIAVVVIGGTPPTPAGQTEDWATYKAAIRAVATDDPSVQVISWESLGNAPGPNFTSDLHYTDTGQQAVADLMVPALAVANLDKLRLGTGTVGLRVGANAATKAYIGATQVWP